MIYKNKYILLIVALIIITIIFFIYLYNSTKSTHIMVKKYNEKCEQVFSYLNTLKKEKIIKEWWPTEGTLIGILRYGQTFYTLDNIIHGSDSDIDVMIRINSEEHWNKIQNMIKNHLTNIDNDWTVCNEHSLSDKHNRLEKLTCDTNLMWGKYVEGGNSNIHVDIHSYYVDELKNLVYINDDSNNNIDYPFQKWNGSIKYKNFLVDDNGLFRKALFNNIEVPCPYKYIDIITKWNNNEYDADTIHIPRGNLIYKDNLWLEDKDNYLSEDAKIILKNKAIELNKKGYASFFELYN
jgi:hypothetical protein